MNKRIMRLYFTSIFLIFTQFCFASPHSPIAESRESKAIEAINRQVRKNEELIRKGLFSQTEYIVDVRGNWWQSDEEDLTPEIKAEANRLLQEINQRSGLAFYTILSSPWINDSQFIIHGSGSITVYHDGRVETFPVGSEIAEAKRDEIYAYIEGIQREFTANVARKSLISDQANKGVLLNIEAILPLVIDEDNKKILEYRPFVALGKRLSTWSVEQAYSEIVRNLNFNRSFYADFGGTLNHFIENIGNNAERIYKNTPGFLADESTLGNIEGTVIDYVTSVEYFKYKLLNFGVAPDDVREQDFGDIRLLDYAGISSIDPNFLSAIQRQVNDFQGSMDLTNLPIEKLKLYIIATSDAFTHHEKTAIQLAHEKRDQLEGEYFILALHFRLNGETPVLHAASIFNNSAQKKIIDQRIELGYNVYRHRQTRQLVLIKNPVFDRKEELVERDPVSGYFFCPYERVADYAYRIPGSTTYIPNEASSDLMVVAVLAWMGGAIEDKLREHEDVAAQWVLDIAFTAATGGIYGVSKTIIQATATVTKGAVIDVALQAGLIMILNKDLTFEQALDSVDYGGAIYSGVENFIGDWKTVAAMGCIREALVEGTQSKKEGAALIKEIGMGCAQVVLSELLFKEAPKKLKPILMRHLNRNYPEFIASLKTLKSDLNNSDIIKLLKALELLDDAGQNTYRSASLKHIVPVGWTNDIIKNGRSAKAFWEEGGKECKHYLEGDIYIKHDIASGDYLVGDIKTGEILRFDKDPGNYQDIAMRWVRSADDLRVKLSTLTPPIPQVYKGDFYRTVDNGLDPLHTHPIPRGKSHRYSKPGEDALYFSSSQEGNFQELTHWGKEVQGTTTTFVYRDVEGGNLLDLTNPTVREELGISLGQITGDSYEFTHTLGTWARGKYDGIIAPSARGTEANTYFVNVIIFTSGTANSLIKNTTIERIIN